MALEGFEGEVRFDGIAVRLSNTTEKDVEKPADKGSRPAQNARHAKRSRSRYVSGNWKLDADPGPPNIRRCLAGRRVDDSYPHVAANDSAVQDFRLDMPSDRVDGANEVRG